MSLSFPVQAQNSHLPLSWCLLDFFEAEAKSWISLDGFGNEGEDGREENSPGQLLLNHGAARKKIHNYFSNLESRKSCLSLTCGKTTATNSIKLVNLDCADSHDEGIKTEGVCPKTRFNILSDEDYPVYKHALLCACCPVLYAPDPPPTPLSTTYSSYPHISETASDISCKTELDGISIIPLETLTDLLRRAFNLNESSAYDYRKKIRDELRKKSPTEILAEELASRLAAIESDCHPFYHPLNFMDSGAYDFWQIQEKETINRLLKKFWHISLPSPKGSYFLTTKHDEYRYLLNVLIRYENGFPFCNCLDHPQYFPKIRPLSSASQRLLKEFSYRYGIGELYCQISYLEILVRYFDKDLVYIKLIQSLLVKLTEDLEFHSGKLTFLVNTERQLLLNILEQLQGECSICFSKIGCTAPELSADFIAYLLMTFCHLLKMKQMLTGCEKFNLQNFLTHCIQESVNTNYSQYKLAVHHEFPKDNTSCLSSKQINMLMLKIRDEVKYLTIHFFVVFQKYFNISKLVIQDFYKFLMADVILLAKKKLNHANTESIDLTFLSVTYRLHKLDLDWEEFIFSSMQVWRPMFYEIFLVWIKAIEKHSKKIVKSIMAADKLTTLFLPPNIEPKILKRRLGLLSHSKKSFVQSHNSAFQSIPPSPIATPLPLQKTVPNHFLKVPKSVKKQMKHILQVSELSSEERPTSVNSFVSLPSLTLTNDIGPYKHSSLKLSKRVGSLTPVFNAKIITTNSNNMLKSSKSLPKISSNTSSEELFSIKPLISIPHISKKPSSLHHYGQVQPLTSCDSVLNKSSHNYDKYVKSNQNVNHVQTISHGVEKSDVLVNYISNKNSPLDLENKYDSFILNHTNGFHSNDVEFLMSNKIKNLLRDNKKEDIFKEKLDIDVIENEENDLNVELVSESSQNNCLFPPSCIFQSETLCKRTLYSSSSNNNNSNCKMELSNKHLVIQNEDNINNSEDIFEVGCCDTPSSSTDSSITDSFSDSSVVEKLSTNTLPTANETVESSSEEFSDSTESESLEDLKCQLKDLLQKNKLLTVFISSSAADILILIHRIINFGKSLCDKICIHKDDSNKLIEENNANQLIFSNMKYQAAKALFEAICAVVCNFADNLLSMDLCATPKRYAEMFLGKDLVMHMQEQKNLGNIWGCRHMKETGGPCVQFYKKKSHFLCDKHEPVTQEMALRLNNVLEINRCLPFLKRKLEEAILGEETDVDVRLTGGVHTSHFEEECKVILNQCRQYLHNINEAQVKLIAYKLNLFCEEALDFLIALHENSLPLSERFNPITDFLSAHLAAIREWLKNSTFKIFINELWNLLVQDFLNQKEKLLLSKNEQSISLRAKNALQCISIMIRFLNNQGHGLELKVMIQDVEEVIKYFNYAACNKSTFLTIFPHKISLYPELEHNDVIKYKLQNYLLQMRRELHEVRKCFTGYQLSQWLKQNANNDIPWWEILASRPSTSDSVPAGTGSDLWSEQVADFLISTGVIQLLEENEMSDESYVKLTNAPSNQIIIIAEVHRSDYSSSYEEEIDKKSLILSSDANSDISMTNTSLKFCNSHDVFYHFSFIEDDVITHSITHSTDDEFFSSYQRRKSNLRVVDFRSEEKKKKWNPLKVINTIKSWLQISVTAPDSATVNPYIPSWN